MGQHGEALRCQQLGQGVGQVVENLNSWVRAVEQFGDVDVAGLEDLVRRIIDVVKPVERDKQVRHVGNGELRVQLPVERGGDLRILEGVGAADRREAAQLEPWVRTALQGPAQSQRSGRALREAGGQHVTSELLAPVGQEGTGGPQQVEGGRGL
ncbi:hypothetical protein E0504_37775 [Parafrankia sp. BMG5.11]|nr:hypothetical protein E0504_37775 [Parafrankia sp. BMG5.11]